MNSAFQALSMGFRTTVGNVRANKQTFFISVMTIAISIGILGLFLLVFLNLNGFLSNWNKHVQMVVYLDNKISVDKKKGLEALFKSNLEIQSIEEVSRDQAWQEFKGQQLDKNALNIDLGFNPLPASYKIRFKDIDDRSSYINELAKQVRLKPGVESVEYGEKWISRFESFMVFCRVLLLGVGVLLSLGLILIVSNTIRLSIYSRQDEIELMLLIGATPRFVKIPFLLEGMLQGLSGSILSLGFMGAIYFYLKSEFHSSIEAIALGIDFQFISQPFLLILVGMSVLIGFVASYISTYQYIQIVNKR
jgi:cell division transport system permease protein